MGKLVRFPQERCKGFYDGYRETPAVIIILPVVRIEREGGLIQGRARRRIQTAFAALRQAVADQHTAGDLS